MDSRERAKQTHALKARIMRSGVWEICDYVTSTGRDANNRFNMSALLGQKPTANFVLAALGRIINEYDPDALWATPVGGHDFAYAIGRRMALPVISLAFEDEFAENPAAVFETKQGQALAEKSARMVGVDDVVTAGYQIGHCLEVPEIASKTTAIASVWVRGLITHPAVGIPVRGVIEQAVPLMINGRHPFFRAYKNTMVSLGGEVL